MDLQQIQTLDATALDALSSEAYREAFQDSETGEAFRAKADELAAQGKQPRRGTSVAQPVARPAAETFDPSFDSPEQAAAQPAAPGTPATPAPESSAPESEPAEHESRWWEYQPTDKQGRAVGGLQRFSYTSPKQLLRKLTAANSAATVHIHELRRSKRLAAVSDAEVAGVPKANPPAAASEPRDMTPDERIKHARLIAESRYREAAEYEQKCMYGVTIGELVQRTTQAEVDAYNAKVGSALNSFIAATPAYMRTDANAQTLVDYMIKGKLDPTALTSWVRAYDAMKDYLETKKPAASVPAPVSIPEPAAAAVPVVAARAVPPIATGLTRRSSSDSAPVDLNVVPASGKYPYTLEQIRKMDSNTYGKLLRQSPAFGLFVDKLEADEAARRQGKR